MDSKKQRNQKNQRDRRKNQERENESANNYAKQEDNNKIPPPQPQRANRRQRNESSAVSNTSQPTSTVVNEKKEFTDKPITVDFSNLKRETDEIAKLTKKFAKREISSNWHRYSVPEGPKNGEQVEENTPADFSDLLHVSLSGGGHLQLKEEKDWSTATGSELGSYFALDLQVLSQGLSCIPAYEQLQIPKHLLSDDDIKRFDMYSEQAKGFYEAFLVEERKNKGINLKKPKLKEDIQMSPNLEVLKPEINKQFNILDLETASTNLINLSIEPDNNNEIEDLNDENNTKCESSAVLNLKQDLSFNSEQAKINAKDSVAETNNVILNKESPDLVIKSKINIGMTNSEKLNNIETLSNELKVDQEKSVIMKKDMVESVNDDGETNLKIEIPLKHNDLSLNNVTVGKNNFQGRQIKKERKSPGRDLYINEVPDKTKDVKPTLEDDDDLDFLLSLKKPIAFQPTKDFKPPPIKESSHVPKIAPQSQPTQEQHSELDDWLDSVLED